MPNLLLIHVFIILLVQIAIKMPDLLLIHLFISLLIQIANKMPDLLLIHVFTILLVQIASKMPDLLLIHVFIILLVQIANKMPELLLIHLFIILLVQIANKMPDLLFIHLFIILLVQIANEMGSERKNLNCCGLSRIGRKSMTRCTGLESRSFQKNSPFYNDDGASRLRRNVGTCADVARQYNNRTWKKQKHLRLKCQNVRDMVHSCTRCPLGTSLAFPRSSDVTHRAPSTSGARPALTFPLPAMNYSCYSAFQRQYKEVSV
jgi:hypothetical protein